MHVLLIALTVLSLFVGSLTTWAGTKISARTSASTPLTGAETVGIIQSGSDRKVTVSALGPFLHAKTYGVTCDGTTDDTTNLQAAIDASVNKTLIIQDGSCKTTASLVIPSSVHIVGTGTGGSFGTVIRPAGTQAFTINAVHHSVLENIMVWPSGAAVANWMTVVESYTIEFKNLRFHLDNSGLTPTNAVIAHTGAGSTTIVYENLVMRSDDVAQEFPIGIRFASGSGSATLLAPDIETCARGIQHDGGKITIVSPYMERMSVFGISTQASTDTDSSLTILGGLIGSANSGMPIAIGQTSPAMNVSILGTHLDRPNHGSQGHVYDLSGATKNIYIQNANFDPTLWTTSVSLNPSLIKFVGAMRPLPESKFTTINVTAGTLAAGDITGAAFTHLTSTNAVPGTQTTRTATQMIGDMRGMPGDSYHLRITNTGAGTLTLGAGVGVTLTGTMTVLQNTFRDFVVTINSTSTLTIQAIGTGTYS